MEKMKLSELMRQSLPDYPPTRGKFLAIDLDGIIIAACAMGLAICSIPKELLTRRGGVRGFWDVELAIGYDPSSEEIAFADCSPIVRDIMEAFKEEFPPRAYDKTHTTLHRVIAALNDHYSDDEVESRLRAIEECERLGY